MSGRPRKLALWYTQNFVPLVNHEKELLPIMEILGFLAKPLATKICRTNITTTQWIVYRYMKKPRRSKALVEEQLPNPKLPYPRIDGLHPSTYEEFLNNVNFYLKMDDISELFHVRGVYMLQSDLGVKWHSIEGDIRLQNYFHKEEMLSKVLYGNSKNQVNDEDVSDDENNTAIRSRGKVLPHMEMKPLKDIITILPHAER